MKASKSRPTVQAKKKKAVQEAAPAPLHTILLNGEHALLRAFLRAWLGRFSHMRVAAECGDASLAVDLMHRHKPSLVLMDFDTLPGVHFELLSKIRAHFPKVKVIVYFANCDDDFAIKLIRAGAAGFVLKSAESDDMERAIKTVMSGGVYLSPGFLKALGTAVSRAGVPDIQGKPLSPRQTEILRLIALGHSTKAMGYELKISAKTVDVHKQALMGRLGVKSTAGLVKYAIRAGLAQA